MAAATAPTSCCAGGKSSPHELLRKLGIKHSRRSLRDPENLKFQQVRWTCRLSVPNVKVSGRLDLLQVVCWDAVCWMTAQHDCLPDTAQDTPKGV